MADARTTRQFATLLRAGAAERVIYLPAAGGNRTITAIIDRMGTDGVAAPGQPRRQHLRAVVLNDSTSGISRGELSKSDSLTVPTLAGSTSTTDFSIAGADDSATDGAIMTLELR